MFTTAPVHLEVAVAHDGGVARRRRPRLGRRRCRGASRASGAGSRRDPRLAGRLRVVGAELLLEQAVVPAGLLLLAQLRVLRLLDAAAAVLARRGDRRSIRALLGEAALALEEELHALPAARTSGQGRGPSNTPPLLLPHPLWACGVTSLTPRISVGGLGERISPSRARSRDPSRTPRPSAGRGCRCRARARVGGHLGGERRRLARALEADRAGRLPGDDVPLLVGERDDRVVERRLDVRLPDRDVLAHAAARAASGRCLTRGCRTPSRGRRSSSGPCGYARSSSSAARSPGAPRRWRMPRRRSRRGA